MYRAWKLHTNYKANGKTCIGHTGKEAQKGLYREWYAVLNGTVRNRKQEISEAKFLLTAAVGVFVTRRPTTYKILK